MIKMLSKLNIASFASEYLIDLPIREVSNLDAILGHLLLGSLIKNSAKIKFC